MIRIRTNIEVYAMIMHLLLRPLVSVFCKVPVNAAFTWNTNVDNDSYFTAELQDTMNDMLYCIIFSETKLEWVSLMLLCCTALLLKDPYGLKQSWQQLEMPYFAKIAWLKNQLPSSLVTMELDSQWHQWDVSNWLYINCI